MHLRGLGNLGSSAVYNEGQLTLVYNRVVQDCEHEGPHYGLRKKLRAAKRGTPLQMKDSSAVLVDLVFSACLTQFFILG